MRRSAAPLRFVSAASRAALGGVLCGALCVASSASTLALAQAEDVVELADIASVQRACRRAMGPGERELYAVSVASGHWRFGGMQLNDVASSDATSMTAAEGGTLFVDTQRNLRIVGGRAEVLPAGLEPIGFTVSRERARLLEQARSEGASLRLGFFLGMDGRDGTLCVIRSTAAVSLVRAEIAFLEIVSEAGRVIAREDTERMRAVDDDDDAVPGNGPRASIGTPYGASVTTAWEEALVAAPRGPVGRALSACHAAGLARGAASDGSVVVRLRVVARTGAVRESEVEIAANGDEEEATCVVRAMRNVSLPPMADDRVLTLSVPVRLIGEVQPASAPAPISRTAPAVRPAPQRGAPAATNAVPETAVATPAAIAAE